MFCLRETTVKIKVVRKDWQEDTFDINGISISLIARAISEKNAITFVVEEYDFIFLHINNEEIKSFVENLEENMKDKLILFSTGNNPGDQFSVNYPFLEGIGNWESFKKLNWNNVRMPLDREALLKRLKQRYTHLIALSILCHGFLVAHGEKDNLHEWVSVWENLSSNLKEGDYQLKTKSKTEERGWWKPALENNYSGDELKKELFNSNKSEKINVLIDFIRDSKNEMLITNTQQGETFTILVNEAYENLSEILEGSF